ncbi:MAG: hypothetical protein ABR555_08840 [Pyrinomonadaceae bacterium]
MKSSYSSKKLGGYVLAFFVLFGVAALASTSVQAQYPYGYPQNRRDRDDRRRDRDRDRDDRYRRDDRYGRNGGYDPYGRNGYDVYQFARQQGYSDGLNTGAADGQRGQSFNPQRSHYWKDGTDGYRGSYGNRGQYKQIFRDAFVQGYSEGYQRYGGYNRNRNGRYSNGRSFPFPW